MKSKYHPEACFEVTEFSFVISLTVSVQNVDIREEVGNQNVMKDGFSRSLNSV